MKPCRLGITATLMTGSIAIISFEDEESCCFSLCSMENEQDSVSNTNHGALRLRSGSSEVIFCLYNEEGSSFGVFTDEMENTCFFHHFTGQLECKQHAVNPSYFTLAKDTNTNSEDVLLMYDDNSIVSACLIDQAKPELGYNLFNWNQRKLDCIQTMLKLKSATNGCQRFITNSGDDVATQEKKLPKSILSPRSMAEATTTDEIPYQCRVDAEGPSLVPNSVTVTDINECPVEIEEGEAFISSARQTVFNFTIPKNWVPGDTELCAVQFRFPPCDHLINGYPCYQWTGPEHDSLAEAGMRWILMSSSLNEGIKTSWKPFSTPFQLIGLEYNMIVGVFGCINSTDIRMETYLVTSINKFSLRYLQAGPQSGFDDGVGAFIVPCVPDN